MINRAINELSIDTKYCELSTLTDNELCLDKGSDKKSIMICTGNILKYIRSCYMKYIVLGKVRDNNDILRVSKTVSNCHCVNINVNRRDHEPFNRPICLYKTQHHANYYCKCKLSTDIEKNPGPCYVNRC